MDENQLRSYILNKDRDPRDKFRDLWEHYFPRLLVYVASFKGILPSEYNDTVSEVLLTVFKKIEHYNPEYSLSTWVYAIAKNYFIDVIRKTKNNNSVPINSIEEQYANNHAGQKGVIDTIIEQDMVDKCQRIIQSLKERDKRLIFLKYYEGLNSREIALVEGIPASTVRQRLMVVKSHIKERMGGSHAH
ncbi:MAG: sigma-70 family RNA polymerase sigma factor [Treponema sp.]|jgi:RNA polymerase sigma-70 factor (ECF subfamily)|nr:sigma-70 family RNA polymerase sigma factor [Treponema sp.]